MSDSHPFDPVDERPSIGVVAGQRSLYKHEGNCCVVHSGEGKIAPLKAGRRKRKQAKYL
jgi:hypothetical protein